MFLAAVLLAGTEQAPVKVRNMSANGAMVDSPLMPSPGTKIHLIRGVLCAQARIVWSSDKSCGLHFPSELSIREWLAAPEKGEQQRIDHIVALAKAGAIVPTAGAHEASSLPRSDEQLVDDLGAVVALMQDLESDLTSSDETVARHGLKLQNLDIAMQMIRAIERELSSADGSQAMGLARLKDLRVACAQALGTR